MGRADLIGNGKKHLIPLYQPKGTGGAGEGQRAGSRNKAKTRPFMTKHTHGSGKKKK